MSIGAPSNLGTLLVQRLDAALGASLAQQATLVNGASVLGIPQASDPENTGAPQNPAQRDTREAVDQASAQGQQRTAVGKATHEMQLDNLLGRATTLHSATQSAPTTLGYAARIILALLNAYPDASPAIRARAPLLPSGAQTDATAASGSVRPAVTAATSSTGTSAQTAGVTPSWGQLATSLHQPGALAAHLAEALTQSIQTSGLFYESHLARLAAGQTEPQTLRQEPQGQIPPETSGRPAQEPAMPADRNSAASLATSLSSDGSTALRSDGTQPAAGPGAGSGTAHTAAVPGIDAQVQGLVRQQLDVLANQAIVWQGEAWPGAAMQWEVQHRESGDSEPRDFEGDHWATQLKLSLPKLGDVQARLSLSGDQLVMRLTAPQSAQRLDGAIEALRTRLLAKGLQASQLSVRQHDEPAGTEASQSHDVDPL